MWWSAAPVAAQDALEKILELAAAHDADCLRVEPLFAAESRHAPGFPKVRVQFRLPEGLSETSAIEFAQVGLVPLGELPPSGENAPPARSSSRHVQIRAISSTWPRTLDPQRRYMESIDSISLFSAESGTVWFEACGTVPDEFDMHEAQEMLNWVRPAVTESIVVAEVESEKRRRGSGRAGGLTEEAAAEGTPSAGENAPRCLRDSRTSSFPSTCGFPPARAIVVGIDDGVSQESAPVRQLIRELTQAGFYVCEALFSSGSGKGSAYGGARGSPSLDSFVDMCMQRLSLNPSEVVVLLVSPSGRSGSAAAWLPQPQRCRQPTQPRTVILPVAALADTPSVFWLLGVPLDDIVARSDCLAQSAADIPRSPQGLQGFSGPGTSHAKEPTACDRLFGVRSVEDVCRTPLGGNPSLTSFQAVRMCGGKGRDEDAVAAAGSEDAAAAGGGGGGGGAAGGGGDTFFHFTCTFKEAELSSPKKPRQSPYGLFPVNQAPAPPPTAPFGGVVQQPSGKTRFALTLCSPGGVPAGRLRAVAAELAARRLALRAVRPVRIGEYGGYRLEAVGPGDVPQAKLAQCYGLEELRSGGGRCDARANAAGGGCSASEPNLFAAASVTISGWAAPHNCSAPSPLSLVAPIPAFLPLLDPEFDFGLERADIERRSKQLVVFDMDSTLIVEEVIDELAHEAGVAAEVARITAAAMRGSADFAAALRRRLTLLRGLPVERLAAVRDRLTLTPGAAETCASLRRAGCTLAVVTSGFFFFANHVKERLGLDFAFANRLELRDGLLTGDIVGPLVDPEYKAEVLQTLAADQYRGAVNLPQTVAVGDGANDVKMLETAGLGIAFCGKPVAQRAADVIVNARDLRCILPFILPDECDV